MDIFGGDFRTRVSMHSQVEKNLDYETETGFM